MDLLDRIGAKRTLVLLHHNADPDAVGSAAALKFVLPQLQIGCPDSVSLAGKRLAAALGVEVMVDPSLDGFEQIVVLDTSTPVQLGGLAEKVVKPIVIDHHESQGLWDAEFELIDTSASSCAEIVYGLFRDSDVTLTGEMGIALLAGIISDTGRFRFATARTFGTVGEILSRLDLTTEEVMVLLEDDDYFNYSKRMAQLKAANRMEFVNVGEHIIVSSYVGSYEAAAARMLLIAGGDVVFVCNNKKKDLRISARAKPHMLKLGVNLGEFMGRMGEELGCQGGGHPGAAGLNGLGDPEKALRAVVNGMRELLKGLAPE